MGARLTAAKQTKIEWLADTMRIHSNPLAFILSLLVLLFPGMALAAETISVSSLKLQVDQDYGDPHRDKSVDGHSISIGGQKFEHGIGTHANSSMYISLHGKAEEFSAAVGIDDETERQGTVVFKIIGDGKELWNSGVMRGGEGPTNVSVDLHGVKTLLLAVGDAGDDINSDHADWAEAKITMTEGRPETTSAPVPVEPQVILTPAAPPQPRINGARVFGVRPGSPFQFLIAATGDRPMTFSAVDLPKGLKLDKKTGRITG